MLFEKFESSNELVECKLGSALTMERDVLKMLDKLEEAARGEQLKQHLRHHAEERRRQLANVERAFAALGWESDDKPCPVIEAIDKEGRAQIERADDSLVDAWTQWASRRPSRCCSRISSRSSTRSTR